MTEITTLSTIPVGDLPSAYLYCWFGLNQYKVPATTLIAGGAVTKSVSFQIVGTTPEANEVLLAWTPPSGETVTFADNFVGSTYKATSGSINPASSYVMTVKKNGTSVGTISISTAGVVTFDTTGGSVEIIGGTDLLEVVGNATPGIAVGFTFTLKGTA